jgi:hypothetical protein
LAFTSIPGTLSTTIKVVSLAQLWCCMSWIRVTMLSLLFEISIGDSSKWRYNVHYFKFMALMRLIVGQPSMRFLYSFADEITTFPIQEFLHILC